MDRTRIGSRATAAGVAGRARAVKRRTPQPSFNRFGLSRAALRERHFRAIFEHNTEPVFILDDNICILAANAAACRLEGQQLDALVGRSFVEMLHAEQHCAAKRAFSELRRRGEMRGLWKLVLPGGAAVEVEYSAQADFMPGAHLLMLREVNDRRLTEQERHAREAAERASQAKSEFMSRMSHELRTPLHAILGFAELMQNDDLTRDQRESVDHILSSGYHLLKLIADVLDVSRIETGHLSLTPEPLNAAELVEEVVSTITPAALKRRQRVQACISGLERWRVLADEQRLRQALLNLLSNAVKYGDEGGRIYVNFRVVGPGRLRLLVEDDGPGIDKAKLSRLFQPFDRLGAERTSIEGSGLGLTITRELVEAMGGSVGVESEPGAGSTFWIELNEIAADDKRGYLVGSPLRVPDGIGVQ